MGNFLPNMVYIFQNFAWMNNNLNKYFLKLLIDGAQKGLLLSLYLKKAKNGDLYGPLAYK